MDFRSDGGSACRFDYGQFFFLFFLFLFVYDDDSEAKRERRHAGISAANVGASIV